MSESVVPPATAPEDGGQQLCTVEAVVTNPAREEIHLMMRRQATRGSAFPHLCTLHYVCAAYTDSFAVDHKPLSDFILQLWRKKSGFLHSREMAWERD